MRKLSTILLILATGAFLACQSKEAKLAEHMARGKAYVEKEKWPEAIIEFKNALQVAPNDGAAHFQLSQAYLKTNKPKDAFWELRETVRLDPKNVEAKLQFAQMSIYAGEFEEALKRADEVIAVDKKRPESYLIKGQAHEGLKKLDEARADYAKAVEVAPDNRAALLVYATFLRKQGDRDAAESQYRHAAKVDPSAQTYLALAGFLAEGQRDDEAEAVFRKAVDVAKGKDATKAYAVLAGFLYKNKRLDDAVAVLDKGISSVENPVDLIYLEARIYRSHGDQAKADELAERATKVHPDDPAPFLVLSAYRSQIGDLDGALKAAEKAMELSKGSDDSAAKLRVAEVSMEIGYRKKEPARVDRARKIVDAVLAAKSDDPDALFVKAKLDIAEKHYQDGITELRKAIDRKPDWAKAHYVLGSTLAITGERTGARTELARALELDPTLVDARRVLVEVHAALGEHEYAVEEGRRYLKERPKDAKVRIEVAQSLMLLGRREEALKEVEAIPEADRDADVNFAIGRIYQSSKQNDKARTHLERALAQRPGEPAILTSLLQLDVAEGKLGDSVARIHAALAKKPDDAMLQQVAAHLALAQGHPKDAEAAYKKAIELEPKLISSYKQLAQLYSQTHRTSEAIDTYEQALTVKPDQPQIHHFLGVLYEYGGQKDRAIEHYEAAIKYDPNLGEAKNNLAYLYAEDGKKLDRALDLAQEAKALLPDNPSAADTLGWVLYRRGVPTAAIGYLKEAVAGFGPDDPNLGLVRHHLAQAYEAAGNTDMAKKTLAMALADHDAYMKAHTQGGKHPPEPTWYADALAMKKRL